MRHGTGAQTARFVSVDTPPAQQGVGEALRSVYRAEAGALPSGMLALLDQINR